MKNKCIFALLIGLALSSCNQQQESTTETQESVTTQAPVYGSDFSEDNILSVTQLQDALAADVDSVQATVSGEIVESCQSKGCWMDVKMADNSTMKVTFRNYGFFLPVEDLKGKSVVFTGTAKREVISVEDQRHYAEDAGKPANEIAAINSPREELRFVADGVKIK
ncbi:DUF4920 domain-containing protein [Pontibacter sp. KCTC 32443]|uniref:DUF4920 domain-containing protein n=1 Tax=Pontibacter TaxID=323449 RepID=UPI00164E9B58|nr:MULTISPECIES: DUF4920 domain-containing protein [Pontibacter]MBC5773211.1 DUF4920 domain-containing protein [Pontibacter sp. KCTC 32443]